MRAARSSPLVASAPSAHADEVTLLCNFEVDWCEALKAAYEKTTGDKAVFIRRTDGESLAQIRAEKSNPRADVYHAAESASAKALAQKSGRGVQIAAHRRTARLGAAHRRGEQVFPDADLQRRPRLRAARAFVPLAKARPRSASRSCTIPSRRRCRDIR